MQSELNYSPMHVVQSTSKYPVLIRQHLSNFVFPMEMRNLFQK